MSESHNEPLIGTPGDETLISLRHAERESSKKAFKVAGLTVLACLLIAGQALTAYFVLYQRGKIGDIEQSNEAMKKQLLSQNSGSSGSKMVHVPIDSMPMRMNMLEYKKPSTPVMKGFKCPQDKPSNIQGFEMQCDAQGNYLPVQCWNSFCWCVDNTGEAIPGTLTEGAPSCVQMNALGEKEIMPIMEELSDG